MERKAGRQPFKGRSALVLWAGWLLGPFAWALHENVSYLLAPWVCVTRDYWTLHLTTIVTLVLAGGGGLVAWRAWRRAGPPGSSSDENRATARSRFLAVGGMFLSALSCLGILVEGIPNLVLDPCLGVR